MYSGRSARSGVVGLIVIVLTLGCSVLAIAATTPRGHPLVKHQQHHHKLLHQGAWAGAGFAAGRAAGPAGSAAVGVAKYRHDLQAGGRRRTKAVAKIGGPIAAGAVAGPPGALAYEGVEHRGWIKRHILHRGSQHSHQHG